MELVFNNGFLKPAVQLADLAAEISKKYFRSAMGIEHKADYSPVTIADKEIEQTLRLWLKQNYPEHGVIGEENADDNALGEYTWIIDPIDGTVPFGSGKPTFTTLIALINNNQPILGIIDQAILNERFIAVAGAGAWLNDKKIATSHQALISAARLNVTTPYMFKTREEQDKFDRLRKTVSTIAWGGDAYAYGLLASGYIDVIMEADLKFWDVAALRPIIEESGGIITDWHGNSICYENFSGQCLASSNRILHGQCLEIINSY